MLRRNKTYPSNHEIKYISPYAKYQYYGKLMLAKNGSAWAKLGEKKVSTSKNLRISHFWYRSTLGQTYDAKKKERPCERCGKLYKIRRLKWKKNQRWN